MTAPMIVLSVLALGAAGLTIASDFGRRGRSFYIFKPLTMGLILILAATASPAFAPAYRLLILAGLGWSLAGDVFLMLDKKYFGAALGCFLIAHLAYIAAILRTMTFHISLGTALPFLVFALFMVRVLSPHLGTLRVPVFVYVLAITLMAALAAERFILIGGPNAFFALAGAIFFVASDSILAVNRFAKKIPWAQVLILSSYFAAQWLFAMSV